MDSREKRELEDVFYRVGRITMPDLKRMGGVFFHERAMKPFNSVLETEGYVAVDGVVYFITSDKEHRSDPRRYTLRKMYPDNQMFLGYGGVVTVGKFQAFSSFRNAVSYLKATLLAAEFEQVEGDICCPIEPRLVE